MNGIPSDLGAPLLPGVYFSELGSLFKIADSTSQSGQATVSLILTAVAGVEYHLLVGNAAPDRLDAYTLTVE